MTSPDETSAPPRPSAPVLFTLSLVLGWSAAAGPHPWDAGELVGAAARLGASHAPGQPLHALLGWAAAHLVPVGPMAWRLSLLSIALAAGAAYLTGAMVGELLPPALSTMRARLAVEASALAVLLAPPVLRQSLRPEVYTLALFLFAAGAWALVRWARPGGPRRPGTLLAAALAAGLALGVHPPHALALALLGIALALAWRREALRRPSTHALAVGGFVAGALVLSYLPLRARAGAPMWGEPTTLEGFVAYVSAAAYRRNLTGLPSGAEAPLGAALRLAAVGGGGVPALAIAGAALARLLRVARRRGPDPELEPALVLGGASLVVLLSGTLFTPDARIPDHAAYLGPSVLVSVVAGALALSALFAAHAGARAAALCTLAIVPTGLADLPERLRADLPGLESLAFALVDAPPPRALALVRSDFVAASWMMDAAVERTRPDVAAFAEGLATSSWHWRALRGHPACPDGVPRRGGAGAGTDPWVRGLLASAAGVVPIAAEDHAHVTRLGWVDGPYVRTPPPGAAPDHALVARGSSGERAMPLVASTLRWAPGGDHDVGAEIVRAAVLERAERLFSRGEVAAAREAVIAATAPLPPEGVAALSDLSDPPLRPRAFAVRDPGALFRTAEDAVRVGASMLHASGRPRAALALLEAQLERGDLRAILQQGWLLLADGATAQARELADLFVASRPDAVGEALPLAEAIARAERTP